jgi:hypothetical protein
MGAMLTCPQMLTSQVIDVMFMVPLLCEKSLRGFDCVICVGQMMRGSYELARTTHNRECHKQPDWRLPRAHSR